MIIVAEGANIHRSPGAADFVERYASYLSCPVRASIVYHKESQKIRTTQETEHGDRSPIFSTVSLS